MTRWSSSTRGAITRGQPTAPERTRRRTARTRSAVPGVSMSVVLQWSHRIKQLYLVLYADHVGIEGPADTACCRQQGVNLALHDVLVVDDLNGSGKCRGPGDVGLARTRRADVDQVRGGGCENEIAGDIERADRVRHARHQGSTAHQDGRCGTRLR
jgi:hypothetical protein